MAITQNFAVELLAGETLKVAGPGLVEFSAPEILPAKMAVGAKGAAVGAGTGGQAVINTGMDPTLITTAGSKATAGTIWNGKGMSLGLGLGLGGWGPVLLIAAAGGYVYWRKKQNANLWPF